MQVGGYFVFGLLLVATTKQKGPDEIGESLTGIHSPLRLVEIWIRWRFREL
jgi:hypothetical protein